MTDRARRVLVIVPAWNEAPSVGAVVASIRSLPLDVLVVDDGSRDDTSNVAAAAGAAVVRLPVNLGVGAALRCGFRYAVAGGYDAVVQCDADGQHPPAAISALLSAQADTRAHLLIGSRFREPAVGDVDDLARTQRVHYPVGRIRRATMRLLARSASTAAGTLITDATSGFRVIAEPLLGAFAEDFPDNYLGDTYEALVSAGRAGYTIREIAVPMLRRAHGESSASPSAAAQFTLRALVVVGSRLQFPVRALEAAR